MNRIFYFLVIVGLVFCSSCTHQSPEYVKIAREITTKTGKKLYAEKGLILVGTGGQMMHDIQLLMMGFNFYQAVDTDTARKLLVYAVEEYLAEINASEKVRPYLHSYPFSPENVEIVIFFKNPDGLNVPDEKVRVAASNRGKVTYYFNDPQTNMIEVVHEETHEKAQSLANKN